MTYFVEGLQGSGKSTLVRRLSEKYTDHTVFREGDYSPVELAWCAYMDKNEYEAVADKYPALKDKIKAKTFTEGERYIVCYTQIPADTGDFYKEMEQYEIYNGRKPFEDFKRIILERFRRWNGSKQIFECSIFQNIVEDMLLFSMASDDEIIEFYRQIKSVLDGKEYRILYLKAEDIRANIEVVKKERSDGQGNEVWFSMLCDCFDNSPYAKANGVSGMDGLIEHLEHRQALELRLCSEVFPEKTQVLVSKKYDI